MSNLFIDLDSIKSQARKAREILGDLGIEVCHSHSLELSARMNGYKNYQTAKALIERETNQFC